MALSLLSSSIVASAFLSAQVLAQTYPTCLSFGVDFQNGGSYFQNASSSDPFTFVSIFEQCQNDVANNILVDPTGDEYQCTDTNLQPDDSNQMSTCPLDKDQLYSGAWSVVIISNNGNADPIAYERDFSLSVGVPSTTTYTPTVTLTATTVPVVNITATSTETDTVTVNTTVTVPSTTILPTTTLTPKKSTVISTSTVGTVWKHPHSVVPVLVQTTHTAACTVPPKQPYADPKCSITPTLVYAAALHSNTAKAKFRRVVDRAVPVDRTQRIAERKARLAAGMLEKRAPDASVVTVTDMNTLDYPTSTTTSTAPATTLYITSVTTTTVSTTRTFTVTKGATTAPQVTVTAPAKTTTKTRYTVATSSKPVITRTQTFTVTKTYINPAASTICQAKGGRMI